MPEYLYAVRPAVAAPPFCGYLKIGRSNRPKSRLANHQIGSPIPLEFAGLWSVRTRGIAIRMESMCHKHFLPRHVHGEWHAVGIGEVAQFIADVSREQCIAVTPAFDGSIPKEPAMPPCAGIGAIAFRGSIGLAKLRGDSYA